MKYFKKYFKFNHLFEDNFVSSPVEISHDEFLELCFNSHSYFLNHYIENGEMCHLVCLSSFKIF